MKAFSSLLLISLLFSTAAFAQCEDGRFRELIFDGVDVSSDVLYGNNFTNTQVAQDLYLDVYEPSGDLEPLRPLVMVAHGGSFIFGSKTGTDVVPLCTDLAKMGYVTASIQYRLGINVFSFPLSGPATDAVQRGVHDSRAAVRFMRKTIAEDGNPYRIDPDRIYMAGVSAGGFIALHHAYMDEESEIPPSIDQTTPGLDGGLEGTSNDLTYSSEIDAVVNIAGAIVDVAIMQTGDQPIVSFHGTEDGTVPYGTATLSLSGFPVTEVMGSETIAARADELGLTNCFEIQEGADHVPHTTQVLYYDTLLSITSNFLSHLVCPAVELDCEYRELGDVVDNISEYGILDDRLTVYPNPTSGPLYMTIETDRPAVAYSIRDLSGRRLVETSWDGRPLDLDISHLQSGIYLIEAWTEEGRAIERIVKE